MQTPEPQEPPVLHTPPRRAALADGPAVLVVNTRSRTGREAFERACAALAERGVPLLSRHALTRPERLPEVVGAALEAGARRVVVGGGDGSLGCAAGVLLGREAALGLLPLGTGNDFAHSLGIPASIEEACDVIAGGHVARVDVALANGRPFLNAASLGLPAAIAQRLTSRLKRRAGKLAYPVAAFAEVWRQRPFEVRLRTDDEVHTLSVLQLVVGNGRYHGAGNVTAPTAALDDRRLDVYAILAPATGRGLRPGQLQVVATLARVALRLRGGEHVEHPAVTYWRTRTLSVEATPEQRLNADGELIGRTPVRFEVLAGALRVLAPPPALH